MKRKVVFFDRDDVVNLEDADDALVHNFHTKGF